MSELLDAFLHSHDPELTLRQQIENIIEKRKQSPLSPWRAGTPLQLMLAGYVGAGNTGSDVRVYEMLRQFKVLLGDNVIPVLSVLNPELSKTFIDNRDFPAVKTEVITYIPEFLESLSAQCHGVVACEGSMFKSNFSEALSMLMLGALGLANASQSFSVGYGAETGKMGEALTQFVHDHCSASYVLSRSEQSLKNTEDLGLRADLGADTAWTFHASNIAQHWLKDAGWNGKDKIVTVCPINPYWWPVNVDLQKYSELEQGLHSDTHYASVFFHSYSDKAKQQYQSYIQAFADSINRLQQEENIFPVLMAMELLDQHACEDLNALLQNQAPIVTGEFFNIQDRVSILRASNLLITSRYHAMVCAMPGGVPSIGVSLDERIENLMTEREHQQYCFKVDDNALAEKIYRQSIQAFQKNDSLTQQINSAVLAQLKNMAHMGQLFREKFSHCFPEYPLPKLDEHWTSFLPSLPDNIQALINDEH